MAISFLKNKSQRGGTLLEISLVLGIISSLIVGSLAFYQSIGSKNDMVGGMDDLNLIETGASSYYQTYGKYAGINNAWLLSSGSVPANMINDQNQIVNSFGGLIKFYRRSPSDINYSYFFEGIPNSETCIRLLTFLRTKDKFKTLQISVRNGWENYDPAIHNTPSAISSFCEMGNGGFGSNGTFSFFIEFGV